MAKTEKHRAGGRQRKTKPTVGKMTETDVARQVETLLGPLLAADGMEIVLVEYRREAGGRVMRLYLDKPGGVSLDDCVAVSRDIGDLLDVSLDGIDPYRLEVSSPGTDRPLAKPAHFKQFLTARVQIRLKLLIAGRKNIRGRLAESKPDSITIETDKERIQLRYEDIARARLIPDTAP